MVLGSSPDSVEKQRKFKEKFALPYQLLADVTHSVAESYGVWKLKSMMGKSYYGIERSTVIIDPAGVVARAFEKVKAEGHASDVAAAIEELRG